MPYIPQTRRDEIHEELVNDDTITSGLGWTPQNAGDLNYVVTCFIDNFLQEKGVRYANINEMIGALECAKMELYRLVASPYEDEKMEENGEVYWCMKSKDEGSY
jgi:hypothetical protein